MPRKKSTTTKKQTVRTARKKVAVKKAPARKKTSVKKTTVKTSKPKTSKKIFVKSSADIKKTKQLYQTLRGMRDILPKDEKYWRKCFATAQAQADHFLFGKIEMPILEEAKVFIKGVGKGTDVVDKEMYVFDDKDSTKVCLRPEGTAQAVRAYIENGMWNNPQPIKLWYWGQMFRHDRPQAGRYRQFFQFSCENFGSDDPSNDAELILLAYNFFKALDLEVEVHINSIGDLEERDRYKQELITYLRTKRAYLCEDCKSRINKNPLRVLDCKQEDCQPVIESAPQIIDWLQEKSKNHLMTVLEYLDEVQVPYVLRPTLVRGLDYYNGVVFEFYTKLGEGGAQSALGGGGRYDDLVEMMGGKPTPAAGFSLGIDRCVRAIKEDLKLKEKKLESPKFDIYLAHLGIEARKVALRIINELFHEGVRVGYNFFKESLKSQLEAANKSEVQYVLIVGQKEVQDETVIIRDMESGIQEIIDQKKLAKNVLKKVGK